MYKKRVLMMFPKASDSTSLWRGIGPFKDLMRKMPDVEFVELDQDLNWSVMWGYDLLLMQRPSNIAHKKAMHLAKDMGVKVWSDYDDDLFSVPLSNPGHLTYGDRDVQRDISAIIAGSDVVTVSTNNLKEKYQSFNPNTFVVPNAWNNKMFSYRDPKKIGKNKVVLWRGTRTHAEDIDDYLDSISKTAAKFPDWKFVFIGGAYWKIHRAVPEKQLAIIEPMEQVHFYRTIYELAPKVMMIPLADHSFNRAKSNISWQEAAFCGAAAVCPNWEEWKNPGALNYRDPAEFELLMEKVMREEISPSVCAKQSWEFIQQNLTLDKINLHRESILRQVLAV